MSSPCLTQSTLGFTTINGPRVEIQWQSETIRQMLLLSYSVSHPPETRHSSQLLHPGRMIESFLTTIVPFQGACSSDRDSEEGL